MKSFNLGLNKTEYKLYIEILKSPPTSISKLAEKVNVKRTTLYSVLDELVAKGLIRKSDPNDPIKYYANKPQKLIDLAEEHTKDVNKQLDELKKQVPLLNVFYKQEEVSDNTEVIAFEVSKSFAEMYEIVGKTTEQMYGLSCHHWFNETFKSDKNGKVLPSDYLDTILEFGDRFAFTSDRKVADEVREHLRNNPELVSHWEPRWIDKDEFYIDLNINSYNDVVLFSPDPFEFEKEGSPTIFVRNESLAKAIQGLCKYLWSNAELIQP